MNKYDVVYTKTITSAKGCQWTSLDPTDFQHCRSLNELKDVVHDYFVDNLYAEGDISVYESTTDIEIPQGFIDDWTKIKEKQMDDTINQIIKEALNQPWDIIKPELKIIEGLNWRLVEQDGVSFVITDDFKRYRLNFVVNNNIITEITTG